MKAQFSLFAPAAPSIAGIDKHRAKSSYSADTIGSMNKVRRPVSCNGDLWVNTGGTYQHGAYTGSLYRLVSLDEFDGSTHGYSQKTAILREGDRYAGDFARADPNGFYHGMRVQSGGEMFILCGPAMEFHCNVAELAAIDAADCAAYARQDAEETADVDEEFNFNFEDDDAGIYEDDELEVAA